MSVCEVCDVVKVLCRNKDGDKCYGEFCLKETAKYYEDSDPVEGMLVRPEGTDDWLVRTHAAGAYRPAYINITQLHCVCV